MSNVLLVDAAFSALPLYRALIAEGHRVTTVGNRDHDPLVSIGRRHVSTDYSDPTALADIVREERIDYLVPGCTDVSYASCAAVNHEMHFPGIDSPDAFETLRDKKRFRKFAEREGLSAPRLIDTATPDFDGALIVKPVDAYSGRGITVLRTPDAECVGSAIAHATSLSSSGRVLVEEFVDGALYSHSAFLVDGRITFDHIVREHCVANAYAVDVSYVDMDFPDSMRAEICKQMEYIAEKLNLRDGLLHTQLIARDARFWIIEVARRCPGDLYSMLILHATGTNYAANYTATFVGNEPTPTQVSSPQWILRQTITCEPEQPFEGFRWSPPAALRALVPVALPGSFTGSSPVRVAVAFYDCGSRAVLLEAASRLAGRSSNHSTNT